MYSCPGCGAMMIYDIPGKQMKCGHCERTMTIAEADERENWKSSSSFSVDLLTCPRCGAELSAMNATSATFCSYCGASVMLDRKDDEWELPEKIIPFRISRNACFEQFKAKLAGNPFVDHRLKRNVTAESFRGIYVPYFSYDAHVEGEATVEGDKTEHDTTYYYSTKINLNHHYTDILHDASKEVPDVLSEQISNVPVEEIVPFSPAYLSGFYADRSDEDTDAYLNYAAAEAVRRGVTDTLRDLKDGLTYNTSKAQNELVKNTRAEYRSTVMVPVWFMAVRAGNRVLYAVQNAVTGKMAADLPMDLPRFGLLAAGVFVPVFLLLNAVLTAKPGLTLAIAMLLAFCAQLAVSGRLKKIRVRENGGISEHGDMKELLKATNKRAKSSGNRKQIAGPLVGAFVIVALAFALISEGLNPGNMLNMLLNSGGFLKVACVGLTAASAAVMLTGRKKKAKMPPGNLVTLCVMMIGCLLLILNPFHSADLPTWICALACILCVLWTLWEMLRLFNKECSNPLPQFASHRGGEDHA